jgi:hypothetical protein
MALFGRLIAQTSFKFVTDLIAMGSGHPWRPWFQA